MGIARYEKIEVNTVTATTSAFGEQTIAQSVWFETRALITNMANQVRALDKFRVYSDVVNMTVNYTPNLKTISDNMSGYSIAYRGNNWRIAEIKESNDRMTVMLSCVRNDPVTGV